MLRAVEQERVACWPWGLRGNEPGGHPIGEACADCGLEIALPRIMAGRKGVCLYCALDCGMLPQVEIEPEVSEEGDGIWFRHRLASVEGGDHEDGRHAKHDSAVAATSGETPNPSPNHPSPSIKAD